MFEIIIKMSKSYSSYLSVIFCKIKFEQASLASPAEYDSLSSNFRLFKKNFNIKPSDYDFAIVP